jgi:3-carboxy-cis,cis-muconate cycloisomerase
LTSDDLFSPLFAPDALRQAVSGEAWVRALLDVEAALASAAAEAGAIEAGEAEAVAAACAGTFEPERLGRAGRAGGNPAIALVAELREAAPAAHFGATSQDALDSAAMLVARRARELVLGELDGVAAACARLAREHRATPMAGRTLLQQAQPITFGLKAAGWLAGVADARAGLRALRLEAQLGGPAGTLAAFGDRGPAVLGGFAARLGLAEPALPWHARRGRVAALGSALAIAAGACEKVALDVVLLAQSEVGEVAEGGGGGSSSMAHKRNPAAAVRARAAARSARAAAGVLLEAMAAEHERAAGAWHAEWSALSTALAGAGGAAWCVRESLSGLSVDAGRMAANLDALRAQAGEDPGLGAAHAFVDRALAEAEA